MNILIIDDHAIFSAGLRQLLAETLDGDVEIGEANNSTCALKAINDMQWDIILLDINLPNRNGIEILKMIRKVRPNQAILMLSMYTEEQYALRALRAGADGYISKDADPEKLLEAIHQIIAGKKYISPSLVQSMALHLQTHNSDDRPPHEQLSEREFDVFIKLSSGKTVSEIADMIVLSVKTVSTYRARILKKMKLKNNAELMQYAIKNKLINDEF